MIKTMMIKEIEQRDAETYLRGFLVGEAVGTHSGQTLLQMTYPIQIMMWQRIFSTTQPPDAIYGER
jgi:hypothetical protein